MAGDSIGGEGERAGGASARAVLGAAVRTAPYGRGSVRQQFCNALLPYLPFGDNWRNALPLARNLHSATRTLSFCMPKADPEGRSPGRLSREIRDVERRLLG